MKIALVHDYIKEYGGAERVLEALHELYPDAPVFTLVYLPEFLGPHKERFKGWDIRTSWFQKVPFNFKLISPLRLLAPFLFRQFDFSEFDAVIVSATGAYSPNNIKLKTKNKQQIHICYCHTPPRYLYGYETARNWRKNPVMNVLGTVFNQFLRKIDIESSKHADYFIANSREVAGRIMRFYKRDSKVIYPPVEFARGPANSSFPPVLAPRMLKHRSVRAVGSPSVIVTPRSYYLAGGRLARPKNIDLIIKACRELKVHLKIFGRGFAGYEAEILKQVRNDTKIEFVGEITDEEKFKLMRDAKAYIFAATDEDFGITPVEAMSVGTPVIAFKGGGPMESVVEGKTGVFFDELSVGSLIKAIKHLNDVYHLSMRDACIKQAEKFSKERFKTEIQMFVNSITDAGPLPSGSSA